MALVLADRVRQTGTANTTVSFTLSGSVTGFQSFAVIGNTNTTYYSATDGAGNWEVGIGTYSTTGPTLTRTTILSSSNSGSAETFSGTVTVFVTYPSSKSVEYEQAGGVVITDAGTNNALRITQTGTGNALLVEDSANPDSSPFVINATGQVLVGTTTPKTTGVGSAVMQIFGGTAPLAFYREADSTTPINLEFAKARAAGAILNSGDTIGRVYFSGSDGTNQIPAAYIDAAVDGTPGTNDMPGRLVFSTTADGAATPTERMRVTSAGLVNISGLTASKTVFTDASKNLTSTGTVGVDQGGTGITSFGTGVATALGVNTGSAGAFVVNGGALGTPSSGTATNLTGTASININGTVGATTANTGAFTTLSATGVTTVQAGTAAAPAITTSGDTNTGIFFPAADTIAFSEGGTEVMRLDSSANLKFNSGYGSVATAYGCRAWVNFNGTGTVAIRGSGNVSSITDGGVGVYTINFTNAMPDANFSWAGSANTASTSTQLRATVQQKSNQSNTTLTLPITTMDGTNSTTSFDSPEICVSVFR
jgi:hypothetical protein